MHSYSERKRTQIREAARIIGVDEPYLSRLADAVYDRIRADTRLGPIFQAEIGEDWGAHLDRMKRFWASVALNADGCSGSWWPFIKGFAVLSVRISTAGWRCFALV